MEKTYVIDSVSPFTNRAGVNKLNVSLVNPDTVVNGVAMAVPGMPLPLEFPNPTADVIAKWVAGATVTGTFEVTAPPPAPAAK